MISKCKVCERDIPPPQYGVDYWCIHCGKYYIVYDDWTGDLESETIRSDNYCLNFFAAYKEASVVEGSAGHHRIINSFPLDELTHEVAIKWTEKLKLYVMYQ